MASERKTENLLEQAFKKVGFTDDDFQFQGADDEEIQRCLPSKRSGKSGAGKPEHIIRLNGDAADILVTECKLDKSAQASAPGLNEGSPLKAAKFAEDGVIHYMKGLRKEFNVIGLAVSGTDTLQITTFKALRGGAIERLGNKSVLKRADYLALLRKTAGYGNKTEAEIVTFAKDLHEYLRDHMELSESYKPLIVSGILLALKNPGFEASYRATPDKDDLAENLVQAISQTLKANKVKDEKREAMMAGYGFIKINKSVKEYLMPTIAKIYRHLFFALQPNSSLDLLGNFYGEFLRYSGGDQQGLGIVLTPRHITELFADLADLSPEESVVLDICTGTGAFLISSMANMIHKAGNNSDTIKRIKDKALVGIELDQHMFTLACANMIFRGDGKSNMLWDDSLKPREDETEKRISQLKPNVAMLNPPYSKKAKGKHELAFVKRALELLQKGGVGIAIVPVGALIDDSNHTIQIKKEILENHTLKAVMSMPPQLFPGIGTVTSIAVFEAHKPHYRYEDRQLMNEKGRPMRDANNRPVMEHVAVPKSESWFGYWRDDGFMLRKNARVERQPGIWAATKKEWLDAFFNQRVIPGKSCKQAVSHNDEWIAEAYLETGYDSFNEGALMRASVEFAAFEMSKHSENPSSRKLVTKKWKEFTLSELFDIRKGKRLTKRQMQPGNTPFIGAVEGNNGVTAFIGQKPIHVGNTISVTYNGSVAEAFYQPDPYWCSDDVNALYPRFPMTPAIGIFLATLIRQEKFRFNYGRKWHLDRMRASTIKLPICANGTPDWSWVEARMQLLPNANIFTEVSARQGNKSLQTK